MTFNHEFNNLVIRTNKNWFTISRPHKNAYGHLILVVAYIYISHVQESIGFATFSRDVFGLKKQDEEAALGWGHDRMATNKSQHLEFHQQNRNLTIMIQDMIRAVKWGSSSTATIMGFLPDDNDDKEEFDKQKWGCGNVDGIKMEWANSNSDWIIQSLCTHGLWESRSQERELWQEWVFSEQLWWCMGICGEQWASCSYTKPKLQSTRSETYMLISWVWLHSQFRTQTIPFSYFPSFAIGK